MEEERKVVNLPIDDILPNRFQPRIKFNEAAINELAESIKLHGVIQPIVVRKIGDKYEIIAGERRYKASIMAGKTTIPALITSLNDKDSTEIALIENVQRQDLTPIEEAISYKKILDMGYINQQDLGSKLGKTQSTIANKLRLLNLSDEVQEALMENKISERHARSLLKLSEKDQVIMLNRIINERLTVRKTDEEIQKMLDNDGSQKIIENEKEENDMNNDILKDFNIPTEPIVNNMEAEELVFDEGPSTEVKEPVTPIEQVSVANAPIFNPFEQATEVSTSPVEMPNLGEVKPVEPLPETNEVGTLPENNEIETPRGGKFFNMFFNEPAKEEKPINDVETGAVNMTFKVAEPPVEQPLPTINPFEPKTTSDTTVTEEELFKPSVEPKVEGPVAPQVEITQPQIEETAAPVNPAAELASMLDNKETTEPVQNIEPIVEEKPVIEEMKPMETFVEQPQQTVLTDNSFAPNMQPIMPENKPSYMMDSSFKFDDDGELEVKLPEANVQEVKVDIKEVINKIRACASEIESYGYKVETDEIDLENAYEVTFKIIKND